MIHVQVKTSFTGCNVLPPSTGSGNVKMIYPRFHDKNHGFSNPIFTSFFKRKVHCKFCKKSYSDALKTVIFGIKSTLNDTALFTGHATASFIN